MQRFRPTDLFTEPERITLPAAEAQAPVETADLEELDETMSRTRQRQQQQTQREMRSICGCF